MLTFSNNKPKIAIIGGGIAGMINARYLKDIGDVVVMEYRDKPLGLWNYTEKTDYNQKDFSTDLYYQEYGSTSSSMYEYLELNTPYPFTQLKDFYVKNEYNKIYLNRREFHDYLLKYYEYFNLNGLFNFNTFAEEVRLNSNLTEDEKFQIINSVEKSKENTENIAQELKFNKKFLIIYTKSSDIKKENLRYLTCDYVIIVNGIIQYLI